MTRSEMRREHIRLWRWLARNPDKTKMKWPGWKRLGIIAQAYCFACEAVKMDNLDCNDCPISWTAYGDDCGSDDSPFCLWQKAHGEIRAALATKIAEMWPKEKRQDTSTKK